MSSSSSVSPSRNPTNELLEEALIASKTFHLENGAFVGLPVGKKKDKKINITPLNITQFKNINQYIKKDFIYIDITNLLGETFIGTIKDPNCFKNDILLKTIAYSLTSNNKRDKARIIYFLQSLNSSSISSFSSSSTLTNLYVYNTKENISYIKHII